MRFCRDLDHTSAGLRLGARKHTSLENYFEIGAVFRQHTGDVPHRSIDEVLQSP